MFTTATSVRRLRQLGTERDGAAIIEFAIVAPVFLLMMLGIFDIGQMAFGKAILNGAVERAARSSTLETANTAAADTMVKDALKSILPGATVTSTRRSFFDFADINRPEKWTDTNNDGTCNNGEPYIDENRSGSWEGNIGLSGNGGAGDVVLYTVNVSYKPVFSVFLLGNVNETRTLTAVGVRKNQPFAAQAGYGSSAGSCT
jgi:Flp pilus assembly protein TadG